MTRAGLPSKFPPHLPPARGSADRRRGPTRGATPRSNPPAPRQNTPRVSVTERELGIKSEPSLGGDAFVDDAAGDDIPRDDSRGEQGAELAEEGRPEVKADEEDDGGDGGNDIDETHEEGLAGREWTTRDNWQARLKSLSKAQQMDLDSEKHILRKSGAPPTGFESDDALTVAALSRLGDYEANRKFCLEWASRDEEERAALIGAAGVEGTAAIGLGWLTMVHWSKSRDPTILPIEVVDDTIHSSGKYSTHLPALKYSTPEHRKASDKTMAACSWLTGERRKSKPGLSTDTGNISDKELTREFVTLVYDTPLTEQGFDGFSQISQVLAPFPAPYVLHSFSVPGHKSTKAFCPFCRYVVGNGHSMNAHIRSHLSLAGVCGHCLQAMMGTQETLFTKHWENECSARPRLSEPTGKTGSGGSAKKASNKGGRR